MRSFPGCPADRYRNGYFLIERERADEGGGGGPGRDGVGGREPRVLPFSGPEIIFSAILVGHIKIKILISKSIPGSEICAKIDKQAKRKGGHQFGGGAGLRREGWGEGSRARPSKWIGRLNGCRDKKRGWDWHYRSTAVDNDGTVNNINPNANGTVPANTRMFPFNI